MDREPADELDPAEWPEGARVAGLYLDAYGNVPDRYRRYLPLDRRLEFSDEGQ